MCHCKKRLLRAKHALLNVLISNLKIEEIENTIFIKWYFIFLCVVCKLVLVNVQKFS